MSLFPNPTIRHARKTRLAALFVGVAALALINAAPASAQQTLALRGDLPNNQSNGGLFGAVTPATDTVVDAGNDGQDDAYVPASQDALPDNTTGGSNAALSAPAGGGQAGAIANTADTADGIDQQPFGTLGSSDQDQAGATADQTQSSKKSSTARKKTVSDEDTQDEPLSPETTGNLRAISIDSQNRDLGRALSENQREKPIENSKKAQYDDDPYAPLGLRLGTFNVNTSIQSGLTATTNADSSTDGKSAILSETTLRLNAVSDWSRHSANINAYGIFRKSVAGQDLSQPTAGVDGELDLDITHELRGKIKLGYAVTPETAESPVIIEGTTEEPLTQTLTSSVGLEKAVGKLRLGITGNLERDIYGNAKLESGGTLSQKDRNNTLVTGVLRAGYELSPSVIPFVEGELGRRYYDLRLDDAGYARSADRVGARAGVTLNLTDKLSGEFSAGWLRETPDDGRLAPISGPSIAADLKWSPIRGTTVSLQGATQIEGTTTAGQSGDILYTGQISLERQMRANLTGIATLGMLWRDYSGTNGHDFGWDAEAGLIYWLNRYAGITGKVRHEQQVSNIEGRDYKAESIFLGFIVQR
ncbi:MAG TPA: outer membrane beta-barrel protein [Rhizobiaceae bacterium]|nr:outer membrane beta-barrel protein [Rhizobiaceae bacterium]